MTIILDIVKKIENFDPLSFNFDKDWRDLNEVSKGNFSFFI